MERGRGAQLKVPGATGGAAPPNPRPTGWLEAQLNHPEATRGHIDGFFGQLPYKCHQNRVASVEE